MACEVEYTDEFESWWDDLSLAEQDSIAVHVKLLEELGIRLVYPYSSGIESSKYSHMRELRVQHQGDPYRVLYAFDPIRNAVLLIGGNKTGNDRWYKEFVPKADRLYAEHLDELREEGKIDG